MPRPSSPTLAEWLRERPFTLCLSSGFFGFFAHTGMLSVLEDEGLLPVRFCGSSAGALVGGIFAAGRSCTELAQTLRELRREHFWDPGVGVGLLRGKRFRALLDEILPVREFAQCRAPVSVSVHDVFANRTSAVSEGLIAPALQASCAVPGLFQPVWIGGRPFVDGGLSDRPGVHAVAKGERVFFHHLASRSPWRRKGAVSMEVPQRENLVSLVIESLPRVGPFRLPEGPRALEAARKATRDALGRPVTQGSVRLVAGA